MQCRDVHLEAVFPNHCGLYFFQTLLAVELAHERLDGRQLRTWHGKVTIRRNAAHGVNLFRTGAPRIEQPHTHVVEQFRRFLRQHISASGIPLTAAAICCPLAAASRSTTTRSVPRTVLQNSGEGSSIFPVAL